MEVLLRLRHSGNRNRIRQYRIQGSFEIGAAMGPTGEKVNDLPGCVHACVRPACRNHACRLLRNTPNCSFQFLLNRGPANLGLKTTVWCAVVRHEAAESPVACSRIACAILNSW